MAPIMEIPTNINPIPIILPISVTGTTSPYPMVNVTGDLTACMFFNKRIKDEPPEKKPESKVK